MHLFYDIIIYASLLSLWYSFSIRSHWLTLSPLPDALVWSKTMNGRVHLSDLVLKGLKKRPLICFVLCQFSHIHNSFWISAKYRLIGFLWRLSWIYKMHYCNAGNIRGVLYSLYSRFVNGTQIQNPTELLLNYIVHAVNVKSWYI